MKILSVTTREPTLRSEIIAWEMEDTNLVKTFQPIGSTKVADSTEIQSYHTILHLVALGWELIGTPVGYVGPTQYLATRHTACYEWWLKKNV